MKITIKAEPGEDFINIAEFAKRVAALESIDSQISIVVNDIRIFVGTESEIADLLNEYENARMSGETFLKETKEAAAIALGFVDWHEVEGYQQEIFLINDLIEKTLNYERRPQS